MNELERVRDIIKYDLQASITFPYDTGKLNRHIYDNGDFTIGNETGVIMMQNPIISYGIILNNAPTIRYGLRKRGYAYSYTRHENIHYGFIDRFMENEAVSIMERELGVKRI